MALALPDEYYTTMASDYAARRDTMLEVLEGAGFRCSHPRGAYYIMTDIGEFGYPDDTAIRPSSD